MRGARPSSLFYWIEHALAGRARAVVARKQDPRGRSMGRGATILVLLAFTLIKNRWSAAMQIPPDTFVLVADGRKSLFFRNDGDSDSPNLRAERKEVLEEDRFAADTAAMLKERALANEYEKLIIVAPPKTLGELRKHYHREVEQRLVAEVPKDLVNARVAEIEEMLRVDTGVDHDVVRGFGVEWGRFTQADLPADEHQALFQRYFNGFDFAAAKNAVGADIGCGSGRWAKLVAPRVGHLHCVEPAADAVAVARDNLAGMPNVSFHNAPLGEAPIAPASLDYAYCLGVLHHTPDPEAGLAHCATWLKPGGQFLLYLYYRFDNRPAWFRAIWRGSNAVRHIVSRLPPRLRFAAADAFAAFVYYPLARSARLLERCGVTVTSLPLNQYRDLSFYTMRTDALDRLGTRIEHRFTKAEIETMLIRSGFENVRFNPGEPYWVAHATKAGGPITAELAS